MCFELKNIKLCLLISTKNHAENMIGLIRREIFQERNGRRRKEGVCDNTDDAHAKRTLAHVLNKRF